MLRKLLGATKEEKTVDQKQLEGVKKRLTKVEHRVGYIEGQMKVYRRERS